VVSASEVDLSWGASTDNVGVTGYKVERCSGSGCTNFAQIGTTTGTGTTYKDTTTVASTTYSYRVRATDAAGNLSTYSNTASATTPAGPSGLVAAYAFDEGTGTTVADASGNGHNGTTSNTTWAATGKFGKALQFNGNNSIVTVPNAATLQLSTGMTLEAWVNPSAVSSTWRDVIYKGNDNYYLEATSTNASKPDAGMIAGGSYADAVGTTALTANTWSYLTETYDGSTLKLYVNGTQVASVAHTGAIASSTNALQIGGDTIYSQYFAGLIDEVRIYNVALSAAQVQSDMTTPIGSSSDTTPPTQPGTLSANAVSASEVDLSWGASTDNVGVTGYKVERCSGSGCTNFAQIGTTTGTGTTYKDTTVSAPNSYSYRVRATDAAGNLSTYSNTASASTTIGPPTKLAFIQGPTNTAAGATITPAVTVAVEDANGNVETSDNATQVSLAIGTNPASGTLSGGSAVTVASGVATFSGLSIDKAGTGYTLTASSTPSYTGATSAAFNITSGTASGSWTAYLAGIDRTGFASGENGFNPTSVQNLHQAWKATDNAPNHGVFPQPVVSNGLVYWGSNDGFERATSTSGNLVWQTNLGRTSPPACTNPSDFGISSTPTITTDVPVGGATSVMYIGGGDSKLYALNAATGAVLWSYDVGGNPDTFLWDSPAVFGNSVYIGVASFGDCPLVQGQVLQINRVTGALQNTFNVVPNGCTGGGIWSSPTLDAAAGTIYFTTGTPSPDCPSTPGGPSMLELRASDLSLVGSWTIPVAQQTPDADFGATPTLFNGVIGGQSVPLVGAIDKNGIFYAFKRDALPSGPVWQTRIATGGGNPTTGQGDQASAAYDGTRLYVGGDITPSCSGTVNALNPSTGAFIWQHCFTDGGFVIGGVTVTSGGVVAVGEGSNVAMVSAATGASVATFTGTGPFFGPPSVAGGTLYEGDMSGNIYALTTN
jgi:outer membrane protein assembly factor BamB